METKEKTKYPLPIREWSKDDRPREKLLKYGEQTLSNAELLAILIRTGTPGRSAVDIGRELLHKYRSLRAMSGIDVSEFKEISGLKDAKIAQIKAAIELGRRMLSEEKALKGPIKSSLDVANFLMPFWAKKEVNQSKKPLNEKRKICVEQLRQARYFYRQARWLQDCFPDAKLRDVAGLVKLVGIEEIEKNDWSLSPGRYVGVAPEEVDENFDFEETMRAIHVEINELNAEAVVLAERIARNFEELGI